MKAEGRGQNNRKNLLGLAGEARRCFGALDESAFHATLALERRRAERSCRPFILLLLDTRTVQRSGAGPRFIKRLTSVISDVARETDILGWHKQDEILGVIFTEVNLGSQSQVEEILRSKIEQTLRGKFEDKIATKLNVVTYIFPQTWDEHRTDRPADPAIYPDLIRRSSKKSLPFIIKRGIDIAGSSLLLIILSPMLVVIAVVIKLTSKGPVIFEQDRLGQFGTKFKCLKFRTMYTNNDSGIHRDYIRSFIEGRPEELDCARSEKPIYKITNDPRVTPVGKLLRKTSLDELPQFWNVMRNEMSIVGPRPPLPYEFEVYEYWHRRRVLEMKPGITGLWQVNGRSRVSFDEMVRLDLRYSADWSLWNDLKILCATPLAVFRGSGAF